MRRKFGSHRGIERLHCFTTHVKVEALKEEKEGNLTTERKFDGFLTVHHSVDLNLSPT
jgi:hypothetical protein